MAGGEDLLEFRPVGNIAFDELGLGWNQVTPSMAEIVVDDDLVARMQQRIRDRPANVTSTSGNQNPQVTLLVIFGRLEMAKQFQTRFTTTRSES
jgi:hypothetical protein